jgi:hypothetical protein
VRVDGAGEQRGLGAGVLQPLAQQRFGILARLCQLHRRAEVAVLDRRLI